MEILLSKKSLLSWIRFKKKYFLNSMMTIVPVAMFSYSPRSLVFSLENLLAIVRTGFLPRLRSKATIFYQRLLRIFYSSGETFF
jgi:hypothetical protein